MKISFKYKYIVILFVVFVVVVSSIISIFKYSRANYAKNIYATSKYNGSKSYISSDLLYDAEYESENLGQYNFSSYDGNNLTFNVYNYESDSQISTSDIVYDIQCSVPSGYTCMIDNTSSSVENISLPVNYTCTNPNMSALDCDNDPNETVTYLKNSNSHTVSVKSSNNSVSTGSVNVNIYFTAKRPYTRLLYANLSLTYNSSEQGLGVQLIKAYENKCVYRLTNYSDTYTRYKLSVNSGKTFEINGIIFVSIGYITLEKYESYSNYIVYLNDGSSNCNNTFTVNAIS